MPPWDLAKQPVWWMRVALAAEGAEAAAAKVQQDKQAKSKT